jgi:hypothetical protein
MTMIAHHRRTQGDWIHMLGSCHGAAGRDVQIPLFSCHDFYCKPKPKFWGLALLAAFLP